MSSDPVIAVERVAKRYTIGVRRADDLGERVAQVIDRLRGRSPEPARVHWALREVSLDVAAGEILGVIGNNGAGKSTLLKLLNGITRPSEGRVRLRGRVGAMLEVGAGFHRELTGRENVFLYGAILGMTRAEIRSKFDAIVAFAGVERFLETPVKRYSSGMYVRLAFAVAAHLDADILLIDEVLSVGDAAFQARACARVLELTRAGRAIVMISHHLATVGRLADRVVWLEAGRIRRIGDPAPVVEEYLDRGGSLTSEWRAAVVAPDERGIRLASIRLVQAGRSTAVVDVRGDFTLEVEVDVDRPVTGMLVGVSAHEPSGLCLFATDGRLGELGPGVHRATLTVPAPILAEGRTSFSVRVWSGRSGVAVDEVSDALVTMAIDPAQIDPVLAAGRRTGLVRPRLVWAPPRAQSAPARGVDDARCG
jgi:lipopolysaccharide transport system ATP-binding protein